MISQDRRRHHRIKLRTPIRGAVGQARVFVTDSSVSGMAIAHQASLPAPGSICRVELASDWGPIRLDCQVVRTVEHTATATPPAPIYLSGLQIVVMDHQSAERLKSLIETVAYDDF